MGEMGTKLQTVKGAWLSEVLSIYSLSDRPLSPAGHAEVEALKIPIHVWKSHPSVQLQWELWVSYFQKKRKWGTEWLSLLDQWAESHSNWLLLPEKLLLTESSLETEMKWAGGHWPQANCNV